jgi:hypothetical protein
VITGYNTDVEYDGVVYHVQTEDKGLQTPIILSLVYVGGAILASKRAPYEDLISAGFDKQILADRLQRQHKLICAAVHAGRIEDLKRMSERDAPATEAAVEIPQPLDQSAATTAEGLQRAEPEPQSSPAEPEQVAPAEQEAQPEQQAEPEQQPQPEQQPPAEPEPAPPVEYISDAPLDVRLIDEPEFRGGTSVVLKALVTRSATNGRTPAANVKVVAKTLSTSFSPSKIEALTDSAGLVTIPLTFPRFRGGRAAVLVQAEIDGLRVELRRIITPSG